MCFQLERQEGEQLRFGLQPAGGKQIREGAGVGFHSKCPKTQPKEEEEGADRAGR